MSLKNINIKNLVRFFLALNKKERAIFSLLIFFVLISNFFFIKTAYLKYTTEIPTNGGIIKEAVVGQPHLINPIYSSVNDIDEDLVKISFNALLKFDKNNKIVPDLAESFEIKENGKVYEIKLKDNLFWHDNEPITVDDVIYTIKTIQDPSYKSPLRVRWLGVEAEKESENTIGFFLEKAYPPFLETIASTKIIPKHIWQNIPAENFPLVEYNLQKVIGSGPYKIDGVFFDNQHSITIIKLSRNQFYFDKKPYIPKIEFSFYPNELTLLNSVKSQKNINFSLTEPENFLKVKNSAELIQIPRHFALFINQNEAQDEKTQSSEFLRNKDVVRAIDLAINKKVLIEEVLNNKAKIVYSPILPDFYDINYEKTPENYNPELAVKLLEEQGFEKNEQGFFVKIIKHTTSSISSDLKKESKGSEVEFLQECLAKDKEVYPDGEITGYFGVKTKTAVIKFQEKYKSEVLEPYGLKNGTGTVGPSTRKKINELCAQSLEEIIPFEISITTIDQKILIGTAEKIKSDLEKIGIKVNILSYDFSTLKEKAIKPRNFQVILFGELLGKYPDLFPFWHSSEKNDPGLNLSGFENKKVDNILKELKQVSEEEKRNELLISFAEIIDTEKPAIFLFNPYYVYYLSSEIKNFEEEKMLLPSERFRNITEWFIKTKRTFKK